MKYSLLVTGPVQTPNNLLKFIAQVQAKPNWEIVLVTWQSCAQTVSANPVLRQLNTIFVDDIPSIPGFAIKGKIKPFNYERMHLLLQRGIKHCTGDYWVRARSDINFDVNVVEKYTEKMDAGLTLTTDVSSVNPHLFGAPKLYFHPCDWVFAAHQAIFQTWVHNATYAPNELKAKLPTTFDGRSYHTVAAAEQLFGLAFLKLKPQPSAFQLVPSLAYAPTAPIDNGYYIIDAQQLRLTSDKYRLRCLHPFRARQIDNKRFRRLRAGFQFFVDYAAQIARKIL